MRYGRPAMILSTSFDRRRAAALVEPPVTLDTETVLVAAFSPPPSAHLSIITSKSNVRVVLTIVFKPNEAWKFGLDHRRQGNLSVDFMGRRGGHGSNLPTDARSRWK